MGSKILVVDDEREIADVVELYLKNENYQVVKCYNGRDALEAVEKEKPDLALLDVMLPDIDGFTILQKIREKYTFPVIMLTAREEETDKVLGLETGADDYITKPFSMRELLARVKTNLRRSDMLEQAGEAKAAPGVIRAGRLAVNTESCSVSKDGVPVELTQREYELLRFLAAQPGKVFSRETLMERVWNYDYVGDDVRTVDVTVRRLREKIEDVPAEPEYIITRRGVGYLFSGEV